MFTYKVLLVLHHSTGVYCPDIAFTTKFSLTGFSLYLSLSLPTSSMSRQCREVTPEFGLVHTRPPPFFTFIFNVLATQAPTVRAQEDILSHG
jgi:hypothetical protein